jgi:hypothetical protein
MNKSLRVASIIIGVCGALLYLLLLADSSVEWVQGGYGAKSFGEQAWFLAEVIVLSGLPPLILTIYFLLLKSSVRANVRGMAYLAVFVPVHLYVAAVTSHGPPEVFLPAQGLELIAAIVLVLVWREKPAPT